MDNDEYNPVTGLLTLSVPTAQWLAELGPGVSDFVKMDIWHGLAAGTRVSYNPARRSFEYFSSCRGKDAFPADGVDKALLMEWISARGRGISEKYMGLVGAATLRSYVAALESVCVDRGLPTDIFEDKQVRRQLAGIARRQPFKALKQAAPITEDILMNLVIPDEAAEATPTGKVDEVNMVAAAVCCFSGFLRGGEVTFEDKDRSNQRNWEGTGLLRSDVTFSDTDEHVTLALKRSKTDYNHEGVEIIMSATGNSTCPVKALRRLFREDLQPINAPLFRFANRTFSYTNFVATLRSRLSRIGVPNCNLFTGHSFRRGAATTAKLKGVLDSDIQRLGRWSSEAFQRYIQSDFAYRLRLSKHFLCNTSLI
jgi:hypothetical protein